MVGAIANRPMPQRAVLRPIQAGGPASEARSVWADQTQFSAPIFQPPVVNPQAGRAYEAKSLIPFWAKAATFVGVWGFWGFPAALLGAVGFWAVEALGRAVTRQP
jgi:hypothetical protein